MRHYRHNREYQSIVPLSTPYKIDCYKNLLIIWSLLAFFMRFKEKKKRQHFVWRKYLRKWANKDSIYCLMDGKIFTPSLMRIGQEKYFYRLKELTNRELAFLKALIEKDNRRMIRELNHGWIDFFNKIFEMKNTIEKMGISDPELDKMFDVEICNYEEDLHCSIESGGDKFLEQLYDKDLSFYKDDEELISFLFFICQQYFRTQNLKLRMRESVGSFKGLNVDAMWPVLRHISATNVGFSLYQDRAKFRPILIDNRAEVSFVTGDQPVINTFAVGLGLDEIPIDLEFYYPLTPWLALLFTDKEEFKEEIVILTGEDEVLKYNRYILDGSGKQVYASNREVLELLL